MNVIIKRSNRRTVGIEINLDAEVIVRAPYRMTEADIYRIIEEKSTWIGKNIKRAEERRKQYDLAEKLSENELNQLTERTRRVLSIKTAYYAELIGVTYGRISIRKQKTRWGSCSSKGNLNYNFLLALAPEYVQNYIVVHELCHRLEMNHSSRFWNEVEKLLPDYRMAKNWLKDSGEVLVSTYDHTKRISD